MKSECRGCRSSRKVNNLSGVCLSNAVPHISAIDQCPCIDCLVKMVCDNKCDDFTQYLITFQMIKMRRGLK